MSADQKREKTRLRVQAWRAANPDKKAKPIFVGIDTEGETDHETGRHFTTMISYSDASGEYCSTLRAKNSDGLNSLALLEFIADIPSNLSCFSYSFGYDLTKLIQDFPNEAIYKLLRPETRPLMKVDSPFQHRKAVRYKGIMINLDNLKISVRRTATRGGDGKMRFPPFTTIWDVIRFCQAPFVARACDCRSLNERGEYLYSESERTNCKRCKGKGHGDRGALEMWDVGTQAERDIVRRMKVKRSAFSAAELDEIEQYNLLECRLLSQLVSKIIDAHENLQTPSIPKGLKLRRFDGPGSSVTALFRTWGLKTMFKEMKAQWELLPGALQIAILSAYFGGRFENRIIGRTKGFNFDINSAYPYQCCFLPCIVHGKWSFTTSRRRVANATLSVIQYRLNESKDSCPYWGPLPMRLEDGCICYPGVSGGGWVWRDEFTVAEKSGLWPGLQFLGAWVFERECACLNPLRNEAELYVQRDAVGKNTGPGIVLKLLMNSTYGKTAQTIGSAPFASWIYAGLITSGCRVQALEALACHKDPANLMAIATDGILTQEDVELPKANITPASECKKPLGGWDRELTPEIFLIRPGVYVGAKLKSRGVNESTLRRAAEKIMADWDMHHDSDRIVECEGETRFIGARQAIYYVESDNTYRRQANYGNWVTRIQQVSFSPAPKREKVLWDGSLTLRKFPGVVSLPYRKNSAVDDEGDPIEKARLEELDQPDVSEEQEWYE